MRYKYTIGIDEVGRGPLAGPVTVCAAAIPKGMKLDSLPNGVKLNDSKKLTAKSREAWAKKLKERGVVFAISNVTPGVIDRINISKAANRAAERSLNRLAEKKGIPLTQSLIFLDGGLYVDGGRTVIKADGRINAVKAASILAKVRRDRYMKKISLRYPFYGFEKHVGYGTRAHIAAIKKHGLSPAHRKSFCRSFV